MKNEARDLFKLTVFLNFEVIFFFLFPRFDNTLNLQISRALIHGAALYDVGWTCDVIVMTTRLPSLSLAATVLQLVVRATRDLEIHHFLQKG